MESRDGRGDLPPGWAWARLDDLGYWNGGGTPSKQVSSFWENGSIPWASPKDMKTDYVGAETDRITDTAVASSAVKLVKAGSVLCVVRSGILRHTFPVAIAECDVTLNQDMRALTPHEGINGRYLQFFLRSQSQRILRECAKDGTTVSSIDGRRLGQLRVPLAPAAEQKRIVSRIEELFGEIEAGEQELEKAREGLAAYRRAILKAAVTGELTREWREKNPPNETGADLLARILVERRAAWESSSTKLTMNDEALGASARKKRYQEPEPLNTADLPKLPPGWTWANVDQLCWFMQYGSSAKCTSEPSGVPVLRMGNIQDGQIDYDNLKYLPEDHPEFPDLLLDAGDVLFNRTNSAELVGKTAVYDGRKKLCSFASYLIRLKLTGVMPEYFSYVLNSSYGREWIAKNKSQQVGQANVSGGKLKKLCIPVPPKAEQQEIVRKVEELLGAANDLETNNSIWVDSVRLRESILAAAFSGKLVPQDPADEPAAALLQRLKASPDRQQTPRSQRRSKAA